MAVETTITGNVRIIRMPARLDTSSVQEMEPELRSFCTAGQNTVAIDLSKTEYVASSGLRVLLQMARDLMKAGGAIVLFGLRPSVRKTFEMAGFLSIFRTCIDQTEALQALK